MTAQLAPLAVQKFFDNNGFPLAFGFLTTYAAGTTTPQATYVDSTQTTQNQNPQQLNFRGEMPLWLNPLLAYKFLLTDVAGNIIPGWPVDNIQGAIGIASNIVPSQTNTFTLGTPTITFVNGYFGPNGAPVFDPVSGDIGYYKPTAAETAAATANGVTLRTVFPYGAMRRYGMDPTGAADSHPGLLTAVSCNADVWDDYPGGGMYLLGTETVLANYPITIRGQAKAAPGSSSGNVGTIFKLMGSAGAGAACLRTNAFTFGLNVRSIGFQWQVLTTGQIGIRCSNDLRASSITDCSFGGAQTAGTTVIGMQFDSASVFSGDVVIRDNYLTGLIKGIWLQGNCTTFKIYANELYGYVGGTTAGQGIQMDYPVTEVSLMNNYFEGWANGIFGNGSAYQRQIGNDYAVCTQPFTWTKTTYTFVRGLCLDGNASGVAPVLSFADVDGNSVFGIMGYFASSSGPMQSTRGYQEGNGSALRAYNMGYPQPVTFASGNYTGNGAMTFGSVTQTVFEFAITGKTLTIWLNISGTVGGTPNTALQVALPGGFIGNLISNGAATIFNNAVWSQSAWQVNASGTVIQFFSTSAGSVNWTAGAVAIQASLSIQVA